MLFFNANFICYYFYPTKKREEPNKCQDQSYSGIEQNEMFWEMMRGIYKKLFAEFFPRNLPMEDFAVPSRRLAEK